MLDTDSLDSFATSKQSSTTDNVSMLGGSVSSASSYAFSRNDTDSHILAMTFDSVKSDISVLSKNLKSVAKLVGKMNRKIDDCTMETDLRIEKQQQDFLKSTENLQTMFRSLFKKIDNPSAEINEQAGVS